MMWKVLHAPHHNNEFRLKNYTSLCLLHQCDNYTTAYIITFYTEILERKKETNVDLTAFVFLKVTLFITFYTDSINKLLHLSLQCYSTIWPDRNMRLARFFWLTFFV